MAEPRTVSGRGSDPNLVSCLESADYLYIESDTGVAFAFDFVQRDIRADSAIENQSVLLFVDIQNPVIG